jgi:dolichyl-diphosphooligosaccharide--protein glycosyltransferase
MFYSMVLPYSGLTALSTYFLTKELWNPGAGLFAACFIAIGKI